MRKFYMLRHEDVNGFSGVGIVAEGVIFDDGTGAFTWLTPMKTITVFTKMADIRRMHGHGGKTEIIIESNKKKYLDCVEQVKETKIKQKAEKRIEEIADEQNEVQEVKEKLEQAKSSIRLSIPPNRRHKSKKDYKRIKVKPHEVEND